jgi:predicted O-methyltransferase YrrM
MNSTLKEIFDSQKVFDKAGNGYELHSNTSFDQCAFLQEIIKEIKPRRSLEIGLAYGISTLAILEGLSSFSKDFHHTIIDPFQSKYWHNVGIDYIKKCGFGDNIDFYERFSCEILPELSRQNVRLQFVYIDSTKVFDILLVDIFFITQMLDVNGVIVLDDCSYPGIRKLARFISVLPTFRFFNGFGQERSSTKRKLISSFNNSILKLIPFKRRVYPIHNFKTDKELNVNYHCIAFQKIKEDNRNWDWFEAF